MGSNQTCRLDSPQNTELQNSCTHSPWQGEGSHDGGGGGAAAEDREATVSVLDGG